MFQSSTRPDHGPQFEVCSRMPGTTEDGGCNIQIYCRSVGIVNFLLHAYAGAASKVEVRQLQCAVLKWRHEQIFKTSDGHM